jgi:hypothetical protein
VTFHLDAPFEIDLDSGVLKFAQIPLTLAPKQSVSAFLTTDAGARAQNLGGDKGWQRYHLGHNLGDGRVLGVSLYFFNSCIARAHISYGSEREFGWSGWTEGRELAKAEEYQGEIVSQLGRRGRFPWGVADAVYDDKAAQAVLFVKYDSE